MFRLLCRRMTVLTVPGGQHPTTQAVRCSGSGMGHPCGGRPGGMQLDIYAKDSFGQFIHFPSVVSQLKFKVPTFDGVLHLATPTNVKLKPTGALDYPNLDEASVKLLTRGDTEKVGVTITPVQESNRLHIDAKYNESVREWDKQKDDYLTDIEIPMVHNIDVQASEEANVDIKDFMESKFINVSTEQGRITANKLKTENLNLRTDTGDIICQGQLHGNIKITTGRGTIVAEKRFVGPNVEVETETGDIRIASSYCDQAKFCTNRGNMHLRNIHNESYIAIYEQGDLKIQGIDGSTNIFVKQGDVDAQVSRVSHESRIHVEDGDVHLKLNENYPLKIDILANEVVPDAKFQGLGQVEKSGNGEEQMAHYFAAIEPNKFSPTLVVVAENGTVVLDSQDWAASLGLKLASKAGQMEAFKP